MIGDHGAYKDRQALDQFGPETTSSHHCTYCLEDLLQVFRPRRIVRGAFHERSLTISQSNRSPRLSARAALRPITCGKCLGARP